MATEQANTEIHPGDEPAAEPSLRDTIDAAFAHHATNEPAQAPAPSPAAGTVRDAHGRFAPKTGDTQAAPAPAEPGTGESGAKAPGSAQAPAQQADPGQPPTPSPAPPPGADLKAPAAWRPEARERWQQLDPQVQGEVIRRERELQTLMQSSAQHRQFVDAFEQIVRPYEVFIRQENSNPLQAVQNLMQTAATLRVGTPHDKVRVVAEIIGNFGIDVQMLDSILAGQPGVQQQHNPPPMRDPRLDQILAQQAAQQAQQAQQEEQQLRASLEKFAETHEFYRDVAATMADLIDLHARRGEAVDLERVYQRACQMDDSVSNILAQRAAAQRAGQQSNAVLRAKRAAASVRGEPSVDTGTVPKNDTVRGAIEAAIEATASR